MGSAQIGAKALLAIAVMLVAVLGVAALAAFFVSRDDPTLPQEDGPPGVARVEGSTPVVKPGNVVLLYSDERLTSDLRALASRTAGAPDAALEAAGQAVLLRRRPNLTVPITVVSATHSLEVTGPDDPRLASFVEYWLGRPA